MQLITPLTPPPPPPKSPPADDLFTYHSSAQRNQRHLHSQQHLLNNSTTTNSRLSGAHAAAATPKSTTGTMPSAQRIAAAASAANTAIVTATAATAIRPSDPTSWVLAPVFVPRSSRPVDSAAPPAPAPSYAQAVGTAGSSGTVRIDAGVAAMAVHGQTAGEQLLCPYRRELGAEGVCRYGDRCIYDHGELCDMCGRYVLSPTDAAQRKRHEEVRALVHFVYLDGKM